MAASRLVGRSKKNARQKPNFRRVPQKWHTLAMSQAMPTRSKNAIPWIVSPAWDLAYLVLTPVMIVPAVLMAARYWLTPEQIYLAVISFASLGHHLPGFMCPSRRFHDAASPRTIVR